MGYEIFLRNCDIFVEAQYAELVAEIFDRYGFDAMFDASGNIIDIDYYDRDMHEDEEFYETLAPFMQDGNYLEFFGELGDIWRWVFYGGICRRIPAVVLWADPILPPPAECEALAA